MSLSVYIQYFKDKHLEVLGHPYLVSFGKDNRLMKEIAQAYGPNRTVNMIDKFFEQIKSDPFLKKAGVTIGVFRSQVPKLLLNIDTDDKQGVGKL